MQNKPIIDFRSDVLSRSPIQMLQTMAKAEVGDDVLGDDPTTNKLQQIISKTFNKQAAVFFPSASMGSLATIITKCRPNQQILIWGNSHCVDRQASNLVMFGGVLTRQLFMENGIFKAQDIQKYVRNRQMQNCYPDTTLLFAENPTFTGHIYKLDQWKKLKQVCQKNNIHLHIDGARIFHALAQYKCKPSEISQLYDTMTICFSKSLSCPSGAIVIGDKKLIQKIRYTRKSLGGTMRQSGILSSACIWALQNMPKEVARDNQIALLLGKRLGQIVKIKVNMQQIQTNMVNFNIQIQNFDHKQYKRQLLQKGIKIKDYNQDLHFYRLVVYPQIREQQIQKFVSVTKQYVENYLIKINKE